MIYNLFKSQRVKIILFVLFIIVIVSIIINSMVLVRPVSDKVNRKIGILDGKLSFKPDDVLLSEKTIINEGIRTHGDEMISFAKKYCNNLDIYYYDVSSINNEITTYSIINGLTWMVENNITKVNLSLSSKIYSKDLEDWIKKHKDIITIYTSYNNRINSVDYPSMYEYVIASGFNKEVEYKDIDVIYNSNRIVIIPKCFMYTGTSYLSLITMIKAN